MSAEKESEFDAQLDPWCVVPLDTGETILFGFATIHPATGGLSWTISTELLHLRASQDGARTRSGRRYRLGRRFEALDVGAEGEEARLAFALLAERDFDEADELRRFKAHWVSACKMARHLGLAPPMRRMEDVRTFLSTYGESYLAKRQRLRRR